MTQNAILAEGGVAERVASRTLARRGSAYTEEVRRLLDAGRGVMTRAGTASSPRVADIVAAAGLSNEAFYRHFASKEALVAAIVEDGTHRLASYLSHQMGKEREPLSKVRRWVEGVMAQAADPEVAASTLAVLWNGGQVGDRAREGAGAHHAVLAALLHQPLRDLGSSRPEDDAAVVAHAVLGRMEAFLWRHEHPTPADVDHVFCFCVRGLGLSVAPRRQAHRGRAR